MRLLAQGFLLQSCRAERQMIGKSRGRYRAMLLHLARQWADTAGPLLQGFQRTAYLLACNSAGTQAGPAGQMSSLNSAHAQQVAERYADTVGPFLHSCPRTADALPPGDIGTQALYLWATAVIASYSFTIGSDRRAYAPAHLLWATAVIASYSFTIGSDRRAYAPAHSLPPEPWNRKLYATPVQYYDAM